MDVRRSYVETHTERPGARGWARVGLYGGLLLSLAGNEAHVWGDGSPGWGPAAASVIWPGLLFVALHISLHMGPGRGWAKWVGLGSVAAFSGAVSYWHLSSVLHAWGYGVLSWLGPLAIDGLMVMSTVVLTAPTASAVVPVVPSANTGPEPQPAQPAPEVHPVMPPQPVEPEHVTPGPAAEPPAAPEPAPRDGERLPQGVHVREGRRMRGAALHADAELLMRASIIAQPPTGMTVAELAASYSPPLGQRTAEKVAARARKPSANGHAPVTTIARMS
jgi:hypothetical protein